MIELPPLEYVWTHEPRTTMHVSRRSVEARERILLARVAEAEEQRGQWAGLCVRLEARIAELEAERGRAWVEYATQGTVAARGAK